MAQLHHMSPAMTRPMARTVLGAAHLYSEAEKGKFDYDHNSLSPNAVKWFTGNYTKELAARQRDIDEQIKVVQTYPPSWNSSLPSDHQADPASHSTTSQGDTQPATAQDLPFGATGGPVKVKPASCAEPLLA